MDYKKILMEKFGYKDYEADLTVEDIVEMDEESKKVLQEYFDGNDVFNYSCGDFSVKKLHDKYGFNIIASILSIANLKKDYIKFSKFGQNPHNKNNITTQLTIKKFLLFISAN